MVFMADYSGITEHGGGGISRKHHDNDGYYGRCELGDRIYRCTAVITVLQDPLDLLSLIL